MKKFRWKILFWRFRNHRNNITSMKLVTCFRGRIFLWVQGLINISRWITFSPFNTAIILRLSQDLTFLEFQLWIFKTTFQCFLSEVSLFQERKKPMMLWIIDLAWICEWNYFKKSTMLFGRFNWIYYLKSYDIESFRNK